MGLVEELQAIRDKAADLERRRARREADIEIAQNARDEALGTLQAQYGVSSIEEARAKLAELHAQVKTDIAAARAALEEVP